MDDAGRELQQDRVSSASPPQAVRPDAGERGAEERLGPLLVSRYRKADGRALILYARVAAAAEESAQTSNTQTLATPSSIAPPRP
jgi:hypothetical protein